MKFIVQLFDIFRTVAQMWLLGLRKPAAKVFTRYITTQSQRCRVPASIWNHSHPMSPILEGLDLPWTIIPVSCCMQVWTRERGEAGRILNWRSFPLYCLRVHDERITWRSTCLSGLQIPNDLCHFTSFVRFYNGVLASEGWREAWNPPPPPK